MPFDFDHSSPDSPDPPGERAGVSWRRIVRDPAILLLIIALIGGGVFVSVAGPQTTHAVVSAAMVDDAQRMTDAFRTFRSYYNREIGGRARRAGIEFTHDIHGDPAGLPIPATMMLDLAESLGEGIGSAQIHLYSDHPYPFRPDGGPQDEFQREALSRLREDPATPFHRFEDRPDGRYLRFATADILAADCVDRHNAHASSPRRDWAVGDVRGVFEVTIPESASVRAASTLINGIHLAFGGVMVLVAVAVGAVTLRVRAATSRATRLAEELAGANTALEDRADRMRRDAVQLEATLSELQGEKAGANAARAEAEAERDRTAALLEKLQDSQAAAIVAQHEAELERDRATRAAGDASLAQEEAERERARAENMLGDLQEERAVTILARHEAEIERDRVRTALADVESARLEAEMASRAKSLFIANMSHEIRTPMTAILGYAELLGDATISTADRDHHLSALRRSGRHLLTTISDILEVGRIESGDLCSDIAVCRPAEVIDQVTELVADVAREQKLDLTVTVDDDVPAAVRLDPRGLRHALLALVGNAIKFTDAGGVTVELRAEADGTRMVNDSSATMARLRWAVTDTGPGVPEDRRDAIFEPFLQCEASLTRQHGGTGLGLTIARRVAESLGGSLSVESAASGSGSTFVFECVAAVADPADADTLPIGTDDRYRAMAATGTLTNTGTAAASDGTAGGPRAVASTTNPPARPLAGHHVLIVEDGADNRRLLGFHTTRAGAEVEMAVNGREGVDRVFAAAADGWPFDIVLMDMQMPVLDGYEATRELRDRGVEVPIIAVTAHASTGDRDACLAAGCTDYATKPIDAAALVARCLALVEAARSSNAEASDQRAA